MKITKLQLTKIFDLAKANFIDLDKSDFDSQQQMSRCYVLATAAVLGLDIEMPTRIFVEPVE